MKRIPKRPVKNRPGLKKQRKRKLKAGVWYVIMLLSLSALAWGYNAITRYLETARAAFKLEQIEISGNEILSKAEVLKQLGLVEKGVRLLEIDPATVKSKLSKLAFIRSVSVVHSLPSTLRIRIVERKPVAFVYGRGLNLVDDEGFILPLPKSAHVWHLPVIRNLGEKLGIQGAYALSPKLYRAVDILAFINRLQAPLPALVSELDFSNDAYLNIVLTQGAGVLKVDYTKYEEQLYKASGFFRDYVDFDKTPFQYVDVRFKDQIVVKNKRKS